MKSKQDIKEEIKYLTNRKVESDKNYKQGAICLSVNTLIHFQCDSQIEKLKWVLGEQQ